MDDTDDDNNGAKETSAARSSISFSSEKNAEEPWPLLSALRRSKDESGSRGGRKRKREQGERDDTKEKDAAQSFVSFSLEKEKKEPMVQCSCLKINQKIQKIALI